MVKPIIYVTYPDLIAALDFGNAQNKDQADAITKWIEETKDDDEWSFIPI